VQQQIGERVSLSAGYNYNWHENFRVTDNLLVSPSDYDPFCITAPRHPDLPGGGGYEVCGLFDISRTQFARVDNLVVPASDFGDQKRVSNFLHLDVSTRLRTGMLLRGGIDSGTILTEQCFVIDSPQNLLNCRIDPPFMGRTQLKLQGSYPLPGDFVVAAIFQNIPTVPYGATYNASNREIAPSLGRNLAACGARTIETCTATVAVPLFNPGQSFEARRTQLDLRLTKNVQLSAKLRLQANLDLYNATNSAALLTTNSTFGGQWRNPTAIVNGRLLQVSGRLTF